MNRFEQNMKRSEERIVHQPLPQDSAHKHVTGAARYADDVVEPDGMLHAYLGLSTIAKGRITAADYSQVLSYPDVVGLISLEDVTGSNDISPVGANDEPLFPEDGRITFHGQPLFAVVARSRDAARKAAKQAKIEYDAEEPVLTYEQARQQEEPLVCEPLLLKRGEPDEAFITAPHLIEGQVRVGGQDHFYLESHIAAAYPGEDEDVVVISSTQHPSEVQHMVAHVLGVPNHSVTVKVRRMGGGFGGKETQSNLFACVAALSCKKFGQAVKLRPDRDDDMIATGKRHDFLNDYKVAFDDLGTILAVSCNIAARAGATADLTGPITDRALFHADNCYYYPHVELLSEPLRTNMVSATAFRGFGGPQGLVLAERIIEEVAYYLGLDPLEVRKRNFYGDGERDVTPYHQKIEDNITAKLVAELESSSDYQKRRAAVLKHNAEKATTRKGIALTPVKFGISFTATFFNQAGALVHIYRDGSVMLNHGGTEMGQGLFTKVAQVVADALHLPIDKIKITETATDKVPNTSATAASTGSDLNAMAALDAATKLKRRLIKFASEHYSVAETDVSFSDEMIIVGEQTIPFAELVDKAYFARVQLSATGFYKTPEIHWDRKAGKGMPFYYFAYGAAVSEVTVDTYTGEYVVDRTDILHDVGHSLNPAIDIGQVEGGFIQGMGWLTSEELVWDDQGRLRTHAPSTYKIPLASDRPREFNVRLVDWSENVKPTISRSKAVGEPPFMLSLSVLEALSMAVSSVADYSVCPKLDTPATPERILMKISELNKL